ncbi:uncharacterized protein LOC128219819 isoform X2 [Mya arenaria]|uniref:uncharacterized protein LOC128219819 isoform X2 n=1 Tax=Mya arenaria TaxID=6604 RepID=UPI0022E8C330|nr:uncharacterized protein LOC128219819 isoform X2 [Mya arenaria]
MNPLNFVIVTILYCFGGICKGQLVFVSQDEAKWNESRCTLAEPNVICRDDGSCIVENGLDFLTNAEDQDNGFWIGFAKTWISYAYVGCGQLNSGAEYSVSTLGECRRTTGCKTFGIQKSTAGLRCKCASNNAPWKQTCGEKCEEADQYPCGGAADTNTFSVYTVENVPSSDHAQDIHRNCLLFYYKYRPRNDYFWESCNLVYAPALLCSNKYFTENNPMAEVHDRIYSNWAQAVESCIVRGKFPASIKSIKNGNFTDKKAQNHWTGIIKTESIISLNDMLGNSTNPPLTYAYVEKMNQTFYVRFANKGDLKKSLCAEGTLPSTAYGNTTYTDQTQAPTFNTTPISLPVPEETTESSIDKDEGGSSTDIVVGVVIAVTLLVVGVLAVMIKRRGMLRACFKNTATAKSSGLPDTAVSTSLDNQQRVEYVNTANNGMDKNTGKSIKGNTYEKLNMTTGVDNYLSIEKINAVEHEYQNT